MSPESPHPAPVIEVSERSWLRRPRRGTESLRPAIASVVMHAATFGLASWAVVYEALEYLAVERGRATVDLIASIEQHATTPPEPVDVEIATESLEPRPVVEPLEPRIEPPQKQKQRPEPVTLMAEAPPAAPAPPSATRNEPEPPPTEPVVLARRVRPAEVEAELVEVDSLASAQSQAMAGAEEPDEQPRNLPQNRPPAYPRAAILAGIEGTTLLLVRVEADGSASDVRVDASSGNDLLDAAAAAAVRRWRFQPATRQGNAVATTVRVPIRFSIRGRF